MNKVPRLSDAELDALLLAQVDSYWQKVAAIVAHAMVVATAQVGEAAWDDEQITRRLLALVEAGKIESAGDVGKWRFSEVRLPHLQT